MSEFSSFQAKISRKVLAWVFLVCLFFHLPSKLSARGFDSERNLSVGGSISSPSITPVFGENPGGLVNNYTPKFLGVVATDRKRPDLLGNAFFFYTGNGDVGADIGFQSFNNAMDESGSLSFFNFGLATYSQALNASIGFDGIYRFKGNSAPVASNKPDDTWAANLGVLYNPHGTFRFGTTIYDVSSGISAYGAGISSDINGSSTLAVDASINKRGQGLTVKPALGINASPFQISYGYGLQVDHSSESGLTNGNTFGLGFEFSPSVLVEAHYNRNTLFYLGSTIRF